MAAVVVQGNEVLLVRHATRLGLELPAARVRGLWYDDGPVETDEQALRRMLTSEASLVLDRVVGILGQDDEAFDISCRFYLCEASGEPAAGAGAAEAWFADPRLLRTGTWASGEPMALLGLAVAAGRESMPPAPSPSSVKRARRDARILALRTGPKPEGRPLWSMFPAPYAEAPERPGGVAALDVGALTSILADLQLRRSLGHFGEPDGVVRTPLRPDPEALPEPRSRARRPAMSALLMAAMVGGAYGINPDPAPPESTALGRALAAALWIDPDLRRRAEATHAAMVRGAAPGHFSEAKTVLCVAAPGVAALQILTRIAEATQTPEGDVFFDAVHGAARAMTAEVARRVMPEIGPLLSAAGGPPPGMILLATVGPPSRGGQIEARVTWLMPGGG